MTRRATNLSAAVLLGLTVAAGPAAAADLTASQVQAKQWWIATLGLQATWTISEGDGVTVAVIDSGVNSSVGDLRGAVRPGFAVGVPGDGQTDNDPEIHGTRMASVIAGRGTGFGILGVARRATILPVAIRTQSPTDLVAAIRKLAALPTPPDVVNISLAGSDPCGADLQSAVTAAVNKGMIIVAGAGNSGRSGNASQSPASCAGVVAVSAFGPNLTPYADGQRQDYIALCGPGVQIIGADKTSPNGARYFDGTSDATAIVSGTMAVTKAHYPKLTPRQIVTRVLYTARQFDGAQHTRNPVWGFGAARPHHALTDSVPSSATNPVYDALDRLQPSGSASADPSSGTSPSAARPPSPTTDPSSAVSRPDASAPDNSSTGLILAIVAIALMLVAGLVVFLVRRNRQRGAAAGSGQGPAPPGWS